MTSYEGTRWDLRQTLTQRVGGFFHNVRKVVGVTCAVCANPASGHLCDYCSGHHEQYGAELADRVYPLSFVRAYARPVIHQSAWTVRAYKRVPPAPKCAEDMALMVLAATFIHRTCIARDVGGPWDAVTFIPSARLPGREHPAAELARQVMPRVTEQRFLLSIGPGFSDPARTVRRDRFFVAEQYAHKVDGHRVLLIDDTWTSGSKAQSAALALRSAGALSVTVLCVGRWMHDDWPEHRAILDRFTDPYDATICPTTSEPCDPAVAAW